MPARGSPKAEPEEGVARPRQLGGRRALLRRGPGGRSVSERLSGSAQAPLGAHGRPGAEIGAGDESRLEPGCSRRPAQGTVLDQLEVSPDSKPSVKIMEPRRRPRRPGRRSGRPTVSRTVRHRLGSSRWPAAWPIRQPSPSIRRPGARRHRPREARRPGTNRRPRSRRRWRPNRTRRCEVRGLQAGSLGQSSSPPSRWLLEDLRPPGRRRERRRRPPCRRSVSSEDVIRRARQSRLVYDPGPPAGRSLEHVADPELPPLSAQRATATTVSPETELPGKRVRKDAVALSQLGGLVHHPGPASGRRS